MRELIGHSRRPVRAATVVGIALAVMLSLVATSAQAGTVAVANAGASQTSRAMSEPVLKNEFGKITSRVVGSFGRSGTVDGVSCPNGSSRWVTSWSWSAS